MISFRAISSADIEDTKNNRNIQCSLIRMHEREKKKNHQIYYDLCIDGERQYALDVITGHIAGKRLYAGYSAWISSSKDFSYVCSEYAIPQAGNYNLSGKRKPIIMLETDNLLSEASEIKKLRNNKEIDDIAIDLSNRNLDNLYKYAFMSEAYNENMPAYNPAKTLTYELYPEKVNAHGLSCFASVASEIVTFKEIKKENIKCIIYPLLQDILYGSNIDMEKKNNIIMENIDRINFVLNEISDKFKNNDLYNYLYPSITEGNNLTDFLYENYDIIKGNNIYEKYSFLKDYKRKLLGKIVEEFNNAFNSKLQIFKIIDDEILVFDIDRPIEISKTQVNDVLIVAKDDVLYKFNFEQRKYVNDNFEIDKQNVLDSSKAKRKKYA